MLLIVDLHSVGQRLDNFLLKNVRNVPKSRIYRMIRNGEVRVNSGRVKASYKLERGENVRVPPLRGLQIKTKTDSLNARKVHSIMQTVKIIENTTDFLLVNKPAGLAVHGGMAANPGLLEILRAFYKLPSLKLGHRLDKATSGLIVVAKSRSFLLDFQRQLREGRVRKKYLAICRKVTKTNIIPNKIEKHLLRSHDQAGNRFVRVDSSGRYALTKVNLIKCFNAPTFGSLYLFECDPITGRTHQIRVHLQSIGFPILGDGRYDLTLSNEVLLRSSRMFLHSWKLSFLDSYNGERVSFESEIPDNFKISVPG